MGINMEDIEMVCEICSHGDLPSYVVSSTLGAMSFNTCSACMAMDAEPNGFQMLGNYTYYDKSTDKYIDKDGNPIAIVLNNGMEFQTRSEYVDFYTAEKTKNKEQV